MNAENVRVAVGKNPTAEELEATWAHVDHTVRVDAPRLKKPETVAGAVSNRPRVRIAYRRNKKGNAHAA
jgi:hypothetical protein